MTWPWTRFSPATVSAPPASATVPPPRVGVDQNPNPFNLHVCGTCQVGWRHGTLEACWFCGEID